MAEQSSITSSDLDPVTNGGTACDHLAELSATRTKFATFLDWIVSDPTGVLAADFKTALLNQLLFDAAKKGWFVRTNVSTGYLELVEKIPVAKLDDTGASDGDILTFDGTDWVVTTKPEIYLAPTVGGVTVPSPSTGGLVSVAHGFGTAPRSFKCVLECTATDAGYSAGDRVDALGLIQRGAGGETRAGCTVGASASLVFAAFTKEGGATRKYFLPNKASFEITDSADSGEIDPSLWNVKLYATP